jgi:K+-transporting ATPase ATPase C chain
MRSGLFGQLSAGVRMVAVMTLGLGVVYPLAVTAFAQVVAGDRADGQLVRVDGEVVGSRLIAQEFTQPQELLDAVASRVEAYRDLNGLPDSVAVPVDAVTASGSGLDPHISPANARLQAARVADARSLDVDVVFDLIDEHTDGRPLGILGDDAVNVVELNMALDRITEGS